MAIQVAVENLTTGLVLHHDVLGEEGQVLLSRGVVISDDYIERLRSRNIQSVFIKILESEAESSSTGKVIPDIIEHQTRSKLREAFQLVIKKKSLSPKILQEISGYVSNVIKNIITSNNIVLGDIQNLRNYDDHTHDHCWTVFVSALALMREAMNQRLIANLDFFSLSSFGMGAIFHDIGKIHIPIELLQKKGKLADEELKIMKSHAYLGFQELRKSDYYHPMTRSIVLQHHQKWDGTGYGPKSEVILRGDKIPFQVRVVTVADSYDALISDRPYRRGITSGEAISILRKDMGTHFDPQLDSVILRTFPEYLRGTVLLLTNGALVSVDRPVMFGDKLYGYIFGSIFREVLPMKFIEEIDRQDILVKANSIEQIVSLMKNNGLSEPIFVNAAPPFDRLLREIFKSC